MEIVDELRKETWDEFPDVARERIGKILVSKPSGLIAILTDTSPEMAIILDPRNALYWLLTREDNVYGMPDSLPGLKTGEA
jgi:hypothetical protein